MNIVRVKDNHSIKVSLKFISPREQLSRKGNGYEYLYTLNNGDGIYLSPQGHDEINRLRPAAGEPFTLIRNVDSNGSVLWGVERIEVDKPAPGPKPMARAIAAASPVPIPPSLTTPESVRLFQQLCAVILASKAAEEFSESIGYPVKFTETSIRAMAISNSIAAQGQNRRAA